MTEPGEDNDRSANVATALVARLAAEAVLVDEGHFTLDLNHARDKLASYQLVDPQGFVLLLVEAGHLFAGCVAISISISAAATCVHFEGAHLTAEELRNIFDAIFIEVDVLDPLRARRTQARQRLALALNTALGMVHGGVELCASRDGRRTTLRFDASGATDVSESAVGIQGPVLTLELRGPGWGWRHRAALEARRELVRTRCQFSTVLVTLDGVSVSRRFGGDGFAQSVDIVADDGRVVGQAGWSAAHDQHYATLLFVANGVIVETLARHWPGGFAAHVDANDLRRDLSQASFVRDERFAARLEAVARAHATLGDTAPARWSGAGNRTVVSGELAVVVTSLLFSVIIVVAGIQIALVLATLASLVPLGFAVSFARSIYRSRQEHRVLARGLAGIGVVKAREHSHKSDVPTIDAVTLTLELMVPGRDAYTTSLLVWQDVTSEHIFAKGSRLYVRVDPNDPDRLMLDTGAPRDPAP